MHGTPLFTQPATSCLKERHFGLVVVALPSLFHRHHWRSRHYRRFSLILVAAIHAMLRHFTILLAIDAIDDFFCSLFRC